MPRDTQTTHRRAVLLASVAGVSSISGCLDRVAEPLDDGDGITDETDTPERRIPENNEGTGSIPLVRLAVQSDAWVGVGPEGFSEMENPPLRLQEGEDYEIMWENLDGGSHEFAIADTNGDELTSTEPAESYAAIKSMVITATDSMAQYLCTFHPGPEQGEIEIV